MMSPLVRLRILAVCVACATVWPFLAAAQTGYYGTNGGEFSVTGSLPGDQVFPDAALSASGGFVVWQDNATDGDGWGISAQQIDSTLSGTLSAFRVNAQGSNDQENARVTLLKNGGAAFVWQGGKRGYQHIFAHFLKPTNSAPNSGFTWLTATDLAVSAFTNNFQITPAVATLNNGNVVVVWSSFNQAGSNSLLDVYAKILSPVGATVKGEFLVNQFTSYNQRSASVAALKNGGFVVAWVSEQQQVVSGTNINQADGTQSTQISLPSVDIFARLFQSSGVAAGNEFAVNTDHNPCANPVVAAASDGTFMVAWSGRDMLTRSNSWDVYARPFSASGVGGSVTPLNTYVVGDQFAPRLAVIGSDYLAVWTSLGQDGSREGVYGRFIHGDGTPTGGEFRVNTTTASQQMQPVVAADGLNQFLAIWTSYTGSPYSFELEAQRYLNVDAVLQAMPAPFVYAPFTLSNNVYQPQLQISWAPLNGITISNYEIYVDGAGTPVAVTAGNTWTMTAANGLTTNSAHFFQLDYVKAGGARPPLSAATTNSTWIGLNYGGAPYEWMATYYGSDINQWPSAGQPLAGGSTLLKVFMSGGNPKDSRTWLTTHLANTRQGMFLSWNTQPGFTYQVQVSANFFTWSNYGSLRFAAGTNDSVYCGGGAAAYYRVLLVR